MQLNSVNNINFKAKFDGEIEKIIGISRDAGVSNRHIKKLLNEVHKVCPGKEDYAYFYFRKYYPLNSKEARIRSGVKIIKDGVEKEANVNPNNCTPETLLEQMVEGIKNLVLAGAHSEYKHHAYKIPGKQSWLAKYKETPYHEFPQKS